MDLSIIEIRKIKYNDYVDKHPNKPYGYYALGELELMCSSYDTAMNYFIKALYTDEHYDRAKIGYILCLLHDGKIIQAIRYFDKKCKHFMHKKILLQDLIHGICSDRPLSNPDVRVPVNCKVVDLRGKMNRVLWIYKRNGNLIAGVLLALHFMNNRSKLYDRIQTDLYQELVLQPGIVEPLRWHMLQRLSTKKPETLENSVIAAMFRYIPSNEMTQEYANTIFSEALKSKNKDRIKQCYQSAVDANIQITSENMWHYIFLAHKFGDYDDSIMKCCISLIRKGWIDTAVAGALNSMIILNMEGYTERDIEMIRLFGYEEIYSLS